MHHTSNRVMINIAGEFLGTNPSRRGLSAMIDPLDDHRIVGRCLEEHAHVTTAWREPVCSRRDAPHRASRFSPRHHLQA